MKLETRCWQHRAAWVSFVWHPPERLRGRRSKRIWVELSCRPSCEFATSGRDHAWSVPL